MDKVYIQVGVTALLKPNGGCHHAIPLYVEADKLNGSGLGLYKESMLRDLAGLVIDECNLGVL